MGNGSRMKLEEAKYYDTQLCKMSRKKIVRIVCSVMQLTFLSRPSSAAAPGTFSRYAIEPHERSKQRWHRSPISKITFICMLCRGSRQVYTARSQHSEFQISYRVQTGVRFSANVSFMTGNCYCTSVQRRFLADRTVQYDRRLASCRPSVRLSVTLRVVTLRVGV